MSTYCYLRCNAPACQREYCAACTGRGGSLAGDEHLRDFMLKHIGHPLELVTEHDDTVYEAPCFDSGRPPRDIDPADEVQRLDREPVGVRVAAYRALGTALRWRCPEAADYLEAYDEEQSR